MCTVSQSSSFDLLDKFFSLQPLLHYLHFLNFHCPFNLQEVFGKEISFYSSSSISSTCSNTANTHLEYFHSVDVTQLSIYLSFIELIKCGPCFACFCRDVWVCACLLLIITELVHFFCFS